MNAHPSHRPRPVDTKSALRRQLRYRSLDELRADLDRIEHGYRAGSLRTTGNWTPGQVQQHCAIFMRCALDGFPHRAPWLMRFMATALYKKKALSDAPIPSGFKIPQKADFLRPDDDITFDLGAAELREVIARVQSGDRFVHPSPLFGRLSHEQWTHMQLSHCGLHLSFLWPE